MEASAIIQTIENEKYESCEDQDKDKGSETSSNTSRPLDALALAVNSRINGICD